MIAAAFPRSPSLNVILALALFACSACSGVDGDAVESAAVDAGDIPICELLTDEQVSTVLPNHDGGFVAASGESLVEGVESYQCSYTAQRGDDFDLLTVILTIAADGEYFEEWIKPERSSKADAFANLRDVEIADGGFLYGERDDMKLEAWKGTTLISLNLTAPGAEGRSDALVGLASAIVAKLD